MKKSLYFICFLLSNIFYTQYSYSQIIEENPKFIPLIEVLKNDTIYIYKLNISENDSLIESIEISQIFIKYTAKKWVGFDKYGYITISKFMRIKKHSSYYTLFSKQIFIPDAEVQSKKSITYNKNADIENYYVHILGGMAYCSLTKKRSLRKRKKDEIMINEIISRYNPYFSNAQL